MGHAYIISMMTITETKREELREYGLEGYAIRITNHTTMETFEDELWLDDTELVLESAREFAADWTRENGEIGNNTYTVTLVGEDGELLKETNRVNVVDNEMGELVEDE